MKKIIDLSMTIREKMVTFGAHWHPKVKITQLGRFGKENRETRKIVIGTHTGTHIDAPRHFIKNGKTIEKVDLEWLCGKALLLDFSNKKDKSEITVSDLKSKIGNRKVERLVLRYDWNIKALGSKKYYTDHPYLTTDACRWIVKKKIKLIGLDAPQPDNPINSLGSKNDAENHKILLKNNVFIVEYLINLNKIKKRNFDFFVCPLKIKDGDGSPARCFAITK